VRHTTVSMSNPADRVEIITSVQRRRRWTAAEKEGQTAGRKHFTIGEACGFAVGSDREAVSGDGITNH
jgi:hypothetical protein